MTSREGAAAKSMGIMRSHPHPLIKLGDPEEERLWHEYLEARSENLSISNRALGAAIIAALVVATVLIFWPAFIPVATVLIIGVGVGVFRIIVSPYVRRADQAEAVYLYRYNQVLDERYEQSLAEQNAESDSPNDQ